MAPYKILKQGYMMKEPPLSKRGIRKRIFRYWFVLVEDRTQVALVYFKTEDAYIARQKNEGFIRVDHASNISVVGEYMGHKNAFIIKTPKGQFHIIPESRYDLHEWLFTLHNALESFKKKMDKIKQRQQQQQLTQELGEAQIDSSQARPLQGARGQQASSSEGTRSRANTGDQVRPSSTAGQTPPYRRAPPPPKAKPQRYRGSLDVEAAASNSPSTGAKQGNESPRRKPVRPAPQAPGGRKGSNSVGRMHSHEEPVSPNLPVFGSAVVSPSDLSQSYPPHPLAGRNRSYSQDSYSNMEPERDGYSTLDSGQHVIVDLNIAQSDRELLSPEEEDAPSAMRSRSASDSLTMMQQMSNSLPEMLNDSGNTTSPDTMETRAPGPSKAVEGASKHSPSNRHTRHLSLMGGTKKDAQEIRSRKKPKRGGSLKQRSRSPPNLPPPPPPPSDPSVISSPEGVANSHLDTSGASMVSNSSSNSLGFSEVMRTMSNIDQQLDAIAESYTTTTIITPSQPPGRPPPPPPSNEQTVNKQFASPSPSHQRKIPSPVPEEVENENGDFCEEEWLCDVPSEGNNEVNQPLKQVAVTNGVLGEGMGVAEQKPKKQHRVMFKEEVEAIPNYEPRVDREDNSGEETAIDDEPTMEEVPTGVAAIKLKLFGQREAVAARYKKDGILSPKYTHPMNMSFSDQYFNTDAMDNINHSHNAMNGNGTYEHSVNIVGHHDNNNNNNSESHADDCQVEAKITPQAEGEIKATLKSENQEGKTKEDTVRDTQPLSPALSSDGEKDSKKHNVYESPWEEKSISKYKVIGIVRKTSQSSPGGRGKDKSPPLMSPKQGGSSAQRMQFAEVSTAETPKPLATEVRNAHSLERSRLKKQQSPSSSPLQQHASPPTTSVSSTDDDDSLLASISSVLQVTSLYGSDTLLCGDPSTNGSLDDRAVGGVKISAKGELEKIKAAHRKDALGITSASSMGSLAGPAKYTSSQRYSVPSSTGSTPYRSGTRPNGGLAATRMTKSLDGLQDKDTEVTYSPHMQAHILRSLV